MNIPLSWLKDYVDVNLPLEEIARVLTMSGLEVDEVQLIGLPGPDNDNHGFKFTGLSWPADKFVVAAIYEVRQHPDADRLTLCQLDDGTGERTILTGAPNLFPYIGKGRLETPIKVAYVREGGVLYDGHKPGWELTKIKKTKIRGFETNSMVCSAKELGICEEHEGILILPDDAPTGMSLADYMGDAVYVVDILPNMIRNANIRGAAREVAAQLNLPLKPVSYDWKPEGPSVKNLVNIEIREPELNPRFVSGLVSGTKAVPSPFAVRMRLYKAGMRPINSIVDATNYVMLDLGLPLHSFDYDALKKRADGKTPTIITRRAEKGERLVTLDNVERELNEDMVLVTDTAGILSVAGVMGGAETEVVPTSENILIESAAWNFVNVRKAVTKLRLNSEAGYRNSRGIHPALAEEACKMCLSLIRQWGGGTIAADLADNYAAPRVDPVNVISAEDVKRCLGIDLSLDEIAALLTRLEFKCEKDGDKLAVTCPPHRLDIGAGVVGRADIMEEIARVYGYDNIPMTRMKDELPPAYTDIAMKLENELKDVLSSLGMQEITTYRMTSAEREARLIGKAEDSYVTIANPISPDRSVMRRNLTVQVMEILEHNIRLSDSLKLYEIGPVFIPLEGQPRPREEMHLAAALCGKQYTESWDTHSSAKLDFFSMKGIVEAVVDAMHIPSVSFKAGERSWLHPGKTAEIYAGDVCVGVMGELHPRVKANFDLLNAPVILLDIDLAKLLPLSEQNYPTHDISPYPAVYEDLAIVVDESRSAEEVLAVIKQGGGKMLAKAELFDIFRGPAVGIGKKSLAYSLMYQSAEKTLTDKDATAIRNKIIKRLDQVLGAKIRS